MIIAGLWVLAMVLHNAIYAVFYSGTAGDEPFFFLLATVVIPLYAMVSLVYTPLRSCGSRPASDRSDVVWDAARWSRVLSPVRTSLPDRRGPARREKCGGTLHTLVYGQMIARHVDPIRQHVICSSASCHWVGAIQRGILDKDRKIIAAK